MRVGRYKRTIIVEPIESPVPQRPVPEPVPQVPEAPPDRGAERSEPSRRTGGLDRSAT